MIPKIIHYTWLGGAPMRCARSDGEKSPRNGINKSARLCHLHWKCADVKGRIEITKIWTK